MGCSVAMASNLAPTHELVNEWVGGPTRRRYRVGAVRYFSASSLIVFGSVAVASKSSAAATTSDWRSTSPGAPMVRPRMCLVTSTRGGLMNRAWCADARM